MDSIFLLKYKTNITRTNIIRFFENTISTSSLKKLNLGENKTFSNYVD